MHFLRAAAALALALKSSAWASPTTNRYDIVSSSSSSSSSGIKANRKVQHSHIPGLYCGIFSTADKRNAQTLVYQLKKEEEDCNIPAKTCQRVSCWNTSGIYVCNDNNHSITLNRGEEIASLASMVALQCCPADPVISKGISGQLFSDEGWNVIIAYANCNHSPNSDRPARGRAPDPWGPNGECR